MAVAQWIQEAEEQARKYSDALKQSNQYLVDQLNASKTNTLNQLQKQQENALYNLNTNQSTINQNALDSAKQLNINRLLALRDNQSAMNRVGLGTQGIVGSQVNSINNNYGTNLSNVLNEKTNQLNDLAKQRNDLNTTYDTNRLNLENEYANNIANLQSQIDDKALNQYNTIYQNYLAMKQQEYENEQAEKAREEARRQWEAEYALNRYNTYNNSNNYSFSDSSTQLDNFGNNIALKNASDYYWKKADGSYTDQPSYVYNQRLVKSGKTAGQIGATSSGVGSNYTVWKGIDKNGNTAYYVWDNNSKEYLSVTNRM